MIDGDTRLAVYGSLAPGRPNHHVIADVPGRWIDGSVRGILKEEGWGSELGYPGIVLDPDGPRVGVAVFESSELPLHWSRLDRFEGPGYRRSDTDVETAEGTMAAHIYTLAVNEGEDPAG